MASSSLKLNVFQSVESVGLKTDFPEPKNCSLKGTIPRWLSGSLIRNGPGKFEIGEDKMVHLFDGYACLHRYNFQDGQVTYQNRLLESTDFKESHAANRIVKSEFGTMAYPDPCKSIFTRHFSYYFMNDLTDNTNVNVMQMGDELYAMTETDKMIQVDPQNLGAVDWVNYKELISVNMATAHPQQDPDGTVYNLAASYGKTCKYHVVKIPPAQQGQKDHAKKMKILASLKAHLPSTPCYSHSFSITENYVILIHQPLFIKIMKLAAARLLQVTFKEALFFDPSVKARFSVINKTTGEIHPITYTAGPFFLFHTINAYEDKGCIVLDMAAYDDADIVEGLSLKHLPGGMMMFPVSIQRFVFPLNPDQSTGEGENLVNLENCSATAVLEKGGTIFCEPQIYDCGVELPRINYDYNGQKYRYIYGLDFVPETTELAITQLVKFDMETKSKIVWENKDRNLEPGEPVFIKAPNGQEEDDGVILTPVISAKPEIPSFLLVLDAATFKEIGRAEIPEGVKVPYTFHGHFYTPQNDN